MSRTQRLPDYLAHIAEAIDRIQSYTLGMAEAEFDTSLLTQDAVIRNLEVIGEASRNIAREHPEFVSQHPDLPLTSAYEMRNALAHGYFKIDLAVVWRTVHNDLPRLRQQLERLLSGPPPLV